MSIDKAGQLGEFDTITREEYRRVNGNGATPAVKVCEECSAPLMEVQVKRGGRFCSQRCSATHNARVGNTKPNVPRIVPPGLHPDDRGVIPIAAALVEVLMAIPGARVEIHVGPIGPIEVRR